MFEKREGKRIFPINRFFRSDYISRHMFRSFFSYTVCYLLCVMLWVLYHMQQLVNTLDLAEVVEIGKSAVYWYGTGLIFYLIITWIVYRKRYEYSKRGMKVYVAKLKRLEKRYEFQNRARELSKEGSRHDRTSRN